MNVPSASPTPPPAPRERVISAAVALFARNGYFQTSVPDIQRAAGVSIGTIYRSFASKDDLASAVYDLVLDTIGEVFRRNLGRDGDFFDGFGGLLADLFRLTEEEPDLIEYALHVKHREISRSLGPICSSEPFQFLRDQVTDAIRQGRLRDTDPLFATATLSRSEEDGTYRFCIRRTR